MLPKNAPGSAGIDKPLTNFHPMPASSLSDIENSIAAFADKPAGGLVVSSDSFTKFNEGR